MSPFHPIHRYSRQHISRTNTNNISSENKKTDLYPTAEDVFEPQAPQTSTAQEAQHRRTSVAPIRSLSLRQALLHPSKTSLRGLDNHQHQDSLAPGGAASATIKSAIEKLEDLLGQLDHITVEAKSVVPIACGPPNLRRTSIRLSPDTRLRSVRLPLDTPVQMPDEPQLVLASPGRRVTFSEDESLRPSAGHHDHPQDAIRACDPVHFKRAPRKAPPIQAEITGPGLDFEMKLLRRRSQSDSRFHEHFTLNPPPPVVKSPSAEGSHTLKSRQSTETRTSTSRKSYKRRIGARQPPPVLPRTSSIRESSHEDDDHFPAGLSPDLKDREPDPLPGHERHYTQMFGVKSKQNSIDLAHSRQPTNKMHKIDLRRLRHVDLPGDPADFDLHGSCHHAPVARDWPTSRKIFAAVIACLNAACIGLVIGIYSGEVPAIQYVILDLHHYTILGNVFLYCAMAIPTLFLWPLPLLHGRKVYTVGGLALALCLQIPQAVAVSDYRSPDIVSYRVFLLISRALSGFAFGFVVMNNQGTLLDCFGASLQSHNPHGEIMDPYDVRRHGGGMGVWLSIWSFASLASVSLGFMIGAFIINSASVMWGFWTCFIILLADLLVNVIIPEVRRSAFRRSLTEIRRHDRTYSRVARGEVKMHLESTGPHWWGEEVLAGINMSWLMVKQPGFMILAIYTAWVYAQFTLIVMLLGALASRYYMFRPIHVGLCVLALTLGAMFAIPFEKASWLSRARHHPPRRDSMTLGRGIIVSSHMVRRILFTVLLPFAALASTLTSSGPPLSVAVPCFFAATVGFLSTLAIAECFGLIMETFDTSDLQPGMTGRPARRSVTARYASQRTNFSCYPRISAGFAITQSIMFVFAATATGVTGRVERKVGAMMATGIVAAALLFLTLLLTVVLARVKVVKIIPDRESQTPSKGEVRWEPVILGTPSGTMRKISLLEAGRQTRWSEIRRRNRLDEAGLTGS